MLNPIQKAISDVKAKVPLDLLMAAFVRREFGQSVVPYSLDSLIRTKVIEGRVRQDCNVVGGNEQIIPLAGLRPEHVDRFSYVFRIPKSMTQNRSIIQVLSLSMGHGNSNGSMNLGIQGYSQLLDAASAVMASHAAIPMVSTARCHLIAENTVLITETMALAPNSFLRCMLEYDDEFSTMRPQTVRPFTRLVELAVKAYIYNELNIPVGEGQLVGGMELGQFRTVLEGYADSEDLYQAFIDEVWQRVALLDDGPRRERHLRMIVARH